jgi:hypothetical protein
LDRLIREFVEFDFCALDVEKDAHGRRRTLCAPFTLSILPMETQAYQHVSSHHLHRYTTEFDFRYNHRETSVKIDGKWQKVGHNDAERTQAALKGISGKRLTYRRIGA